MPPLPANFVFLVETGFLHAGDVGVELLTAGDLPSSASQSAAITGMSHCTRPSYSFDVSKAFNKLNHLGLSFKWDFLCLLS